MDGQKHIKFINMFTTGFYPEPEEFIVHFPIVFNINLNFILPSTSSSSRWFQ